MAGHTELHEQNLGQLQPKVFPESVVYQRSENLQVETPVTAIPPTTIVSPRCAPSRTVTSGGIAFIDINNQIYENHNE